jgi:hypothetical protein
MTRVFLSYRHENTEHSRQVRDLAVRLETAGLTVVLDQFAQEREFHGGGPDEGWPRWSKAQAASAQNKVLIVGSPGWFRAYEQTEIPGKGLGATAEAGIIEQRLHNSGGRSRDVRIVCFEALNDASVPLDLQRYHRFRASEDFDDLVRWLTGGATSSHALAEWPAVAPSFAWVMANHDTVREAFAQLVVSAPPFRYLPIRGPSESGKSHITRQLLGHALRCEGLACGRFDFKGTGNADSEFERFTQHLDLKVIPGASNLSHRFGVLLAALSARKRPCLLIFDTFEAAGEMQQWVEESLLVSLIRQPWLRVVIAGQHVPARGGKAWDAEARETIVLTAPSPSQWFDFGRAFRPDLKLSEVETVHLYARGRGSLMYQLLGPASP